MNDQVTADVSELKGSFRGAVLASLLITLAAAALSAWAWSQIPPGAKIPIHWGAGGQANGYGGRGMLFFMPGICLGLTLIFAVLPCIEPRRGNLLRSSKALKVTWLGMMLFMAGLHVVMVLAALGRQVAMNQYIAIAMGLLFVLIGNFFGKIRSNFVFGVRTPWTLSSERSWNKTHRLTGWLFVIYGVLMLLGGVIAPTGSWILWSTAIFVPALIAVAFTYSYLVWKNDPDKQGMGK